MFSNITSNGTYDFTLDSTDGLNYSTTYYFRLKHYNDFNSHSSDHLIYPYPPSSPLSETTLAQPTLSVDIYDYNLIQVSGDRYKVRVFYSVQVVPTNIQGRVDIGGGYFTTSESSPVSQGGNDYYIDLDSTSILLLGAETVDVELTVSRSGYTNDVDTVTFKAEALEPPKTPTATAIYNANGDIQVSWTRDNLSEYADVLVKWYVNDVFDSQQTITATNQNSVTKSFPGNDGDKVYAILSYTTGLDTSPVQTNDAYVDVLTATTYPENFQATDFFNRHELQWNHPDSGAPDSYQIQYYNGYWNVLDNNVSGGATTYTSYQTSATKYQIRAYDNGVYSSWVEATVN